MHKSNAVKRQERNVRRLQRDFPDKVLRRMQRNVDAEMAKLERQLDKLRQERVELTLALEER